MKYALVVIEKIDGVQDCKSVILFNNYNKARLKMLDMMNEYIEADDKHNACTYTPTSIYCDSDNGCDELHISIIETEKGD